MHPVSRTAVLAGPAALLILLLAGASTTALDAADLAVTAQGRLTATTDAALIASASGDWRLEVLEVHGGWQLAAADLALSGPDGSRRILRDVAGTAFLVADSGRLIAITDVCDGACPTRVQVLDAAGRELWAQDVGGLCDPALSSDGASLVWRHREGTSRLDLQTLTTTSIPPAPPSPPGRATVSPASRRRIPTRWPSSGVPTSLG